jgi:butyrate kinase
MCVVKTIGYMCFKQEGDELVQFSNVFESYEFAKKYSAEILEQLGYKLSILAVIDEEENK